MRKQESCLEKETMQGTMPGACRRGRPCTAWIDNIKTWTGLPVEESVRMTEINGESASVVWPAVGPRTAKEQDRGQNVRELHFSGACSAFGRPIRRVQGDADGTRATASCSKSAQINQGRICCQERTRRKDGGSEQQQQQQQ